MATPVFVSNANYTCPAGKTATLHVYGQASGVPAAIASPCNEIPFTATSVAATTGFATSFGTLSASVILSAGQSLTYNSSNGVLLITGWAE